MPGETTLSGVATLGARPVLPFILSPVYEPEKSDLLEVILGRLNVLQAMSERSQLELTSLRRLNTEILEAVNQQAVLAAEPPATAAPGVAAAASRRLTLSLLGPFEAHAHGRPVSAWPGRKARLLLAYLALEKGRLVPKDVLIEQFWPGARGDRGANNLSIAVHQIRACLAAIDEALPHAIIVRQGLYGIDAELVHVDLWELQAALDAARHALEGKDKTAVSRHLREAVALWRGDLLASDPYEEWTEEPRRVLDTACHQALTWLATEAAAGRDWPGVLDFAGRILQRDACDEAAHRLVIDAHLQIGNRSQALRQYRVCLEALRDELGVGPSPETIRLGERIHSA